MQRTHADILLLIVAAIWGAAFVAQKAAMDVMGPLTFTAVRFLLSALVILPFVLHEFKVKDGSAGRPPVADIVIMCAAFCFSAIVQQVGVIHTSVTNAGFLTGLYVVFVPLICGIIFREKIPQRIIPAALLAVIGAWLLSGGSTGILNGISYGDGLILMCAAGFGLHVAMIGRIMQKWKRPLLLCLIQHIVITLVSGIAAPFFESPALSQITDALWAILYAGVLSGGIAYSLQMVAQQYTPSSDSAILLSAEAVFAALFGWMLAGDKLGLVAWTGCAIILAAIAIVEAWPHLSQRFSKTQSISS